MHYGDEKQIKKSRLELVIYKHEVLGTAFKRNKNGVVSKRCVDYEIASIQKCKFFNPRVLKKILENPYKFLSKDLDDLPTEEWVKVEIVDLDGWGKIQVKPVSVVSEHPKEIMRLH